jgi:hypothetical protein
MGTFGACLQNSVDSFYGSSPNDLLSLEVIFSRFPYSAKIFKNHRHN